MFWIAEILLGVVAAICLWAAFRSEQPSRPERLDKLLRPRTRFPSDVFRWPGFRFTRAGQPFDPRFATWEEAFNRPVTDSLRFHIEYADKDSVITERDIRPLTLHLTPKRPEIYIRAFCERSGDERTFRSDRVLSAVNLGTHCPIRDLGAYLRHRY